MSTRANERRSKEPPIVPIKYAGQWIAWNGQQTRIIASGSTWQEARQAAIAAGEPDPVLDKVPRARVRFVGRA
jgi:hypothetical protein